MLASSAGCTCVNSIGQASDPAGYDSCPGHASVNVARRAGTPEGAACTDSSECEQISCGCGSRAPFYAAACIGGVCTSRGACACVAGEFQKNFHHDICN
jgi:hypothetical protein